LAASVAGIVFIALRWNRCSHETDVLPNDPKGRPPLLPECTPLLPAEETGERPEEFPVAVEKAVAAEVSSDESYGRHVNHATPEQDSVKSTESSESFETIFDPCCVSVAETGSTEEESMLWWITDDQ
jgi:hypothetical protein